MKKSMMILDLSELPEGETVDSFLKTVKEKGVMVVNANGKESTNTKIINYEVDDDKEVQERVDKRIKAFVGNFDALMQSRPLVYEEIKRVVKDLGYNLKI